MHKWMVFLLGWLAGSFFGLQAVLGLFGGMSKAPTPAH